MIKLFLPTEMSFGHNRDVLTEISAAEVSEQGNGDFSLEIEAPLSYADRIFEDYIITAPTPRGVQPFRVYSTRKTLTGFRVSARHIFYDTAANFLADCRPTNATGIQACSAIMAGRLFPSLINLSSDIPGIHTAYYVRKTELEALMGAGNSLLSVWGGHLIRDGFTAYFRNDALDRNFKVELGHNLTGVEAVVDMTQVATKVMPTWVLDDNQVYTLPEKYIASPLATQYATDIVRELRIELTEEQRQQPATSLYPYIREQVAKAYADGLDKPQVSYRVNFVLLAKTEAYKNLELLEQLDIWDLITCHVPTLGIDVQLKMSAYRYDAIREQFISMDLGGSRPTSASMAKRVERSIADQVVREDSPVMIKINAKQKELADSITGTTGGNIILRRNESGKPYEILAMDTDDVTTAVDVIRINRKGIGLSTNGINGPFGIAMDSEHGLYADYIYGLRVTAAMIEAGAVTAEKLSTTDLFSINGNFTGDVTMTSGRIGNWLISGSTIDHTATGSRLIITADPARSYFLYAGPSGSQYNFLVTRTGVLTATGATINGTVKGTGWYINQNGTFSFANGQMTFDGYTLRVPEVQTARELQLYANGQYNPSHSIRVSGFSGSDFSGTSSGIGLNFSSGGQNAYIGFSGTNLVITINGMKVFESTGAWTRITTQYAGITVSNAGLWGDYPGGAQRIWQKP